MCLKAPSPLGQQVAALFAAAVPADADSVPPPRVATPARSPSRRRRLWDLDHKHHCPIIGTCLTLPELRKLAGRSGNASDEFTLHVEAAGRAGSRNPVAEALQKHLDRKYASCVRIFAGVASDTEVLALWQAHLARGDVAGPLWAALTHPAASPATGQQVYADIHMLSHQVGAGQAADARRLAWLDGEHRVLKASLAAERRERAAGEANWRSELQAQQARNLRLHSELADRDSLRERLAAFESGVTQIAIGRELVALKAANATLQARAERAAALESELAAATAELRRQRDERDRLECEREALERLLLPPEPTAKGAAGPAACDGDCGNCGAPARRILCVGGRSALVGQYRRLAERLGIRLTHHDGGQEEAMSRLPDLINGADAVLCPTDCVSHSAYYRLKNHCKRHGKPCLLFKGAGVSSFAVALMRLADGQVTLSHAPEEAQE